MRTKNRATATREDLLWEMDKKTAALKRIHRICNELLDEGEIASPQFAIVKKIRYLAGAHYPALEPQAGDRLEIKAR
jgi:hypothetical protein